MPSFSNSSAGPGQRSLGDIDFFGSLPCGFVEQDQRADLLIQLLLRPQRPLLNLCPFVGALAAIATTILGAVGLTGTGLSVVRIPYAALVLDALFATGVFAAPRLLIRFAGRLASRSTNDRRGIVVGAGASPAWSAVGKRFRQWSLALRR